MTTKDLILKPQPPQKLCNFPHNNGWYQHVEVCLPDGTNIGRLQTKQRPGPAKSPRQAETMTANNHSQCVHGHDLQWLLNEHLAKGQPSWATAGRVEQPAAPTA